jgi:hypothetical protein
MPLLLPEGNNQFRAIGHDLVRFNAAGNKCRTQCHGIA